MADSRPSRHLQLGLQCKFVFPLFNLLIEISAKFSWWWLGLFGFLQLVAYSAPDDLIIPVTQYKI